MKRDITFSRAKVAEGDAWFVKDQLETEARGVYRHSIALRFEYVRRQLERLDLSGKTVLDLGCGDGQWSLLVGEHFDCDLVGVDYNELRVERYARNVPRGRAEHGTCYDIPLADASADLVLFNQVLEHLEEPGSCLREIRRVLRPGGLLIVSVPNEGTWLKQKIQYRFVEPKALETTDHIQFFTKETLSALLRASGFRVLRLDLMGFYFPHNGISRRLVSRKAVYRGGLALARVLPVLHDCIYAVCDVE